MTKTMTVTVFDRAAEERTWGQPGGGHPVLRTITISATCPRCDGPRGPVRYENQHEDGEWYRVSRWENPCGHGDSYRAVIVEADAATPPA